MARRTVGCIGTGVMGSALMEAVAKSAGAGEILLRDSEPGKAESLAARLGCAVAGSNRELAKGARFVFLAVKPAYLAGVLDEIGPALTQDTVLVSMAAGVPIDFIKRHVDGHPRVVRIMPNMPASVGAGMIAVASGPSVPASDVEELLRLLAPAGLAEITGEALMDAVTAVSGSGPAYGFIFIEALADAAVRMGMPRVQAIRYAAQTLKGAAESVLVTGTHPAALKDGVCSPAGTTIAAVAELEARGFRAAVMAAAQAAFDRSRELGK
ncbi:MAG TPA: pyrroline-5-carboxylate reductase [Treponemataceae bacterium]|nr:pyrroline-5-carboxylate reductase [Treponemataceae bacterium]